MAEEIKKTSDAGDGDASVPARRVGLIEFFRQVNRERKKVTWPTMKETRWTTLMVFIMVGITMVFFMVIDFVFTYGERLLIGVSG